MQNWPVWNLKRDQLKVLRRRKEAKEVKRKNLKHLQKEAKLKCQPHQSNFLVFSFFFTIFQVSLSSFIFYRIINQYVLLICCYFCLKRFNFFTVLIAIC